MVRALIAFSIFDEWSSIVRRAFDTIFQFLAPLPGARLKARSPSSKYFRLYRSVFTLQSILRKVSRPKQFFLCGNTRFETCFNFKLCFLNIESLRRYQWLEMLVRQISDNQNSSKSQKKHPRDTPRSIVPSIARCPSLDNDSHRKCSRRVRCKSRRSRCLSACMCCSSLCSRTSRRPIPASNCKYRIRTCHGHRKP